MIKFLQYFQALEKTFHSQPLFLLPLLLLPLIFLFKSVNKNNGKNPPPSPQKLPILGNIHQLTKPLHHSLFLLSQKHSHGGFMLLHLGCKPTLVISSATAAQQIMKTHDITFSNRPNLTIPAKLFYNGRDVVFAGYGEYWRQRKTICMTQVLNSVRVRSFRGIREEETASMVERIKGLLPSVVNLTEVFATVANDVVCRAAFGRKYREEEKRGSFMVVLNKLVDVLGEFSMRDMIPWLGWMDKMNGLEYKVEELVKELDGFLEGVIDEHLHAKKSNLDKTKDFVDVLLEVQRDSTIEFPLDRECIKALILNIFAGGTTSSAALLEWAMSELLRNPNTLKNLLEEVRRVSPPQQKGVYEHDLEKMKYLKAVIKETLRLHPPGPLLIFRESTADTNLNGYDIAAKTQVIVNAWAIQRDPSFWDEPNEFRPERFLGDSKVDFKGQHFEFVPFGAGRRICPGIPFAMVAVELALANVVYWFDWALPGQAEGRTLDMSESEGISVHRRHPLLVVATPL